MDQGMIFHNDVIVLFMIWCMLSKGTIVVIDTVILTHFWLNVESTLAQLESGKIVCLRLFH